MSKLRKKEAFSRESSELAEKRRDDKRRICNVVHNCTWLAETSVLLLVAVFQVLSVNVDPLAVNCFSHIWGSLIFWRIIAPYTHLFNEERIRLVALEKGWVCAIKEAINFNVSEKERQPRHGLLKHQVNYTHCPINRAMECSKGQLQRKQTNECPAANRTKIFTIAITEEYGRGELLTIQGLPNSGSRTSLDLTSLPNSVPEWHE